VQHAEVLPGRGVSYKVKSLKLKVKNNPFFPFTLYTFNFLPRGTSCLKRLLQLFLGNGPLEIFGGGLPIGSVLSGVN
jgi:hypothetical protein